MKVDEIKDQLLYKKGEIKQLALTIENMREKHQKNEVQIQAMNLNLS